jgi:hypothetical protein
MSGCVDDIDNDDDESNTGEKDIGNRCASPPVHAMLDTPDVVEQTIQTMETKHLCVPAQHGHAFQPIHFAFGLRTCAACRGRLGVVVFGHNEAQGIVKCVTCQVLAHRRCALAPNVLWQNHCVGTIRQLADTSKENETGKTESTSIGNLDTASTVTDTVQPNPLNEAVHERDNGDTKDASKRHLDNPTDWGLTWTDQGPPHHWASSPQNISLAIPTISLQSRTSSSSSTTTITTSNVANDGEDSATGVESTTTPALHYANHPFASVSRALQENVVAHFRRRGASTDSTTADQADENGIVPKALQVDAVPDSKPVDDHDQHHPLLKLASGTYEAAKASVTLPRRIGVATVAGGIAGGMAGIVLAGPAGALAGYKLGQACGMLGVILEGSVSIGVFVASVATAGYTAQQLQEMNERRVLTMGEESTSLKVLLVRPNIQIDPIWAQICTDAKRDAPKESTQPFHMFSDGFNVRYRRDEDIVKADEDEIPTNDKILLLVSRILNDKSSMPGYVYRALIEQFCIRGEERARVLQESTSVTALSTRSRRDDAHAVIKHVTATLLEVRPGFGHSRAITELTAAAVESLVFGKLYDSVFGEIAFETEEIDTKLLDRVAEFEASEHSINKELVSEQALAALCTLPEAHSAVDKLHYGVKFLELLSSHFSESGNPICADSLLKMACQHILAAKLPQMNAEVAFLEEFARDEQLLKGREGYALVTLQASMHFLNLSQDFYRDIFAQEDTEDNIPLEPSEKGTYKLNGQ